MAWGSRVLVCCVLAACAGDNHLDHLDPGELELRDLLGMAPEMALSWDATQRAAARHVIDEGMHTAQAAPIRVPLQQEGVEATLAYADNARAKEHQAAVGVVSLDVDRELTATAHPSAIAARPAVVVALQFVGWNHPGLDTLPARGTDVLTAIATDAGHRSGPILVTPAAQLAVVAAYIPGAPAHLMVNPVLLASLDPVPTATTARLPTLLAAADTTGNPYSFYGSIAECANAQRTRCESCLPNHSCTAVDGNGDGNAQCSAFADEDGRGYSLECINLAIAIDSVETCTLAAAPSCPFDATTTNLNANADFLDRPECASPLDACLAKTFGGAPQATPHGSTTSCSDASCDAEPSCADSCGDDSSGDSCDSGDDSSGDSCDSGDGGDCSGDSGGDCSGGGGDDCSGGGDSCAGDSGGGCSGGGGDDCNASKAGRHGHDDEYLWALLPLPFAVIARRRADRRRAKKAVTP